MSKTYGASIRCAICGAEPWPSSDVRETFSLTRYGPNGLPSDSPAPGEWRCEEHPIASQTKRVRATPTEALADFQDILEAEIARLGNEASDRGASRARSRTSGKKSSAALPGSGRRSPRRSRRPR
jgi:hypothetical protein